MSASKKPLQIDIQVKLAELKVAFSIGVHDIAYNADRKIATGNPYKGFVADLMKRGVKIELCGATAKAHKWGNSDLLPGIKVNTDAMARTTQLVQEGFVKITE